MAAQNISNYANCKSILANGLQLANLLSLGPMTGLQEDTELMRSLCTWAGLSPSVVAKRADLTPTTVLRAYNGKAETRISTTTLEKLRRAFPDFPGWTRPEPDQLVNAHGDDAVQVELLPTFAGLGGGGTGDGEPGTMAFSGRLVASLRATPADLMAIQAEGNSMEPDFCGGDQILIDRRRRSLAAPGAFCLWDGDGYVVKYLERIPNTDPPRVRIISRRGDLYPPYERLVEELDIRGRVVWYGRQVM